jgi:hypothetical protein
MCVAETFFDLEEACVCVNYEILLTRYCEMYGNADAGSYKGSDEPAGSDATESVMVMLINGLCNILQTDESLQEIIVMFLTGVMLKLESYTAGIKMAVLWVVSQCSPIVH